MRLIKKPHLLKTNVVFWLVRRDLRITTFLIHNIIKNVLFNEVSLRDIKCLRCKHEAKRTYYSEAVLRFFMH